MVEGKPNGGDAWQNIKQIVTDEAQDCHPIYFDIWDNLYFSTVFKEYANLSHPNDPS